MSGGRWLDRPGPAEVVARDAERLGVPEGSRARDEADPSIALDADLLVARRALAFEIHRPAVRASLRRAKVGLRDRSDLLGRQRGGVPGRDAAAAVEGDLEEPAEPDEPSLVDRAIAVREARHEIGCPFRADGAAPLEHAPARVLRRMPVEVARRRRLASDGIDLARVVEGNVLVVAHHLEAVAGALVEDVLVEPAHSRRTGCDEAERGHESGATEGASTHATRLT